LSSKDRELLIGVCFNGPVGVVRFDINGDAAETSIYLIPDSEYSGQGRNLLNSAEQWLKTNRPEIKSISARVLGNNHKSKNLFLRSNYFENTTYYQKYL
jgi:RimJ/RimL family protein N-acetyltransferase